EDDVEGGMAEATLPADAHALADDRDPGLVVTSAHGRAVAADDVAFHDRPHARAGLDGVHVRAEEERRCARCPRQAPDQVARLAPDVLPRIVELRLGTQLAKLVREPLGDPALATREAVDRDQLEKERLQAIGLDHTKAPIHEKVLRDQRGCGRLSGSRGERIVYRMLGSGPVLIAGAGALGSVVGGVRVLGARVIFGAEVAEPGRARVTVYADPVLIGSPDPFDTRRRDAAVAWAADLTAAGIPAESSETIVAELWAKLLYSAALNPLGALLGLSYGALAADADTRTIMDAVIEEA